MRHVEKALLKYNDECKLTHFIKLKNVEDVKGVAPIVSFTIQSDPISEVSLVEKTLLQLLNLKKLFIGKKQELKIVLSVKLKVLMLNN